VTPVSIAAILLSIVAISFGCSRVTTYRLLLFTVLLVVHLLASIYYYQYSQMEIADASAYYYDPYHWGALPWGVSTKFVVQLCYVLKVGFHASYLDCFLVFQWFGFAGLMIMARVFDEIQASIGVPEHRSYYMLLFLPSVNFWTSAIGKDAPMFFAVALCVWAMMNLRKRFFYFTVALVIMVLFRAHLALMAAVSVAGASLFGSSKSLGAKIAFMAVALAGIALTSGAVQSSFGVNPTDPSSVSAWLEQQNAVFATLGGTTSLGNASYPMRVVSLLFRPLFIDAQGILGIIASFENLGAVAFFLYALSNFRDVAHLARRVPFVRFVLIFAFVLLFSMTLVYYNVGLGLRQRVMAYPMIFAVMVSLWSMRHKRSLESGPSEANRLMAKANTNRPLAEH
jgi:hypothetical protein